MKVMVWIILGAIILLVMIFFIAFYNRLVSLKNKVKEAFSTIGVYLKKRHDLIPNLLEAVKGYAIHEKSALENVINARSAAIGATNTNDKFAAENMLTGTLKSLFAVAESYPDLKANTNFLDLQRQLQIIEDEIAMSRKYYNANVREYNIDVKSFPNNIVSGITGFKEEPYFNVDKASTQPVEIKFND